MKKLICLLLATLVLLSFAACTKKESTSDGTARKFTVIVVHADGSEKTFEYESDEANVGPVLTEAGLIKGNAGPYGLEITEVDGEEAIYDRDKAYWAVFVGEEYALTGIDTTPITEGGVYKLVYTLA